jgi:hypothetical protein
MLRKVIIRRGQAVNQCLFINALPAPDSDSLSNIWAACFISKRIAFLFAFTLVRPFIKR